MKINKWISLLIVVTLANLVSAEIIINSESKILLPTSISSEQIWKYTFNQPGSKWNQASFDDSAWKENRGPFGTSDIQIRKANTEWTTKAIWLRKTIDYDPKVKFNTAVLIIHHNQDVEVYLNGRLIFLGIGYLDRLQAYDITDDLKGALKPGKNLLAVKCVQILSIADRPTGGQYIDVGIELDPVDYTVLKPIYFESVKKAVQSRWDAAKAWKWYKKTGPIIGCNYLPRTAVNDIDMWMADTFDPETIDQELGWAQKYGFNSVRVFVNYVVYQHDPEGLKERINQFLSIADRHGISTMMVLLDDCFRQDPAYGKQPEPIPGVHNSQWVASPGKVRTAREYWPELKSYVQDIVGKFKQDSRILIWDLYNEPKKDKQWLVVQSFLWAREMDPIQPITTCWLAEDISDVITFHYYKEGKPSDGMLQNRTSERPAICTECIKRTRGSGFETVLPAYADHGIGWYMWGLVKGRIQTYYPWGSPEGAPEPEVWHHDLLHPDGTPYDPAEITLIQNFPNMFVLPYSNELRKDPFLIEYFDFQEPGHVFQNKAAKAEDEPYNIRHVQAWPYEGRQSGRRGIYFYPGLFLLTSSKDLGFKDAMTLEVWLCPVDHRDSSVIYSAWDEDGDNRSFELSLVQGKPCYKISPDGKREIGFISDCVLDEDKWYYLAASFNKGVMKIYLNGKLQQTFVEDSVTSVFNPKSDKKRCIAQPSSNPQWAISHKRIKFVRTLPPGAYIGLMDELAVYTRALSAEEVARHYNQGKPAKDTPMRESVIYNGQDKISMDSSFFTYIFPETQPIEVKDGESFTLYDKALPSDRDASFWELNSNRIPYVKGWKKHISENTVYHALLRNFDKHGNKNWEIGIGKGGQLYSWRGPWGEAIPPQFFPWNDEVWQAVASTGDVFEMLRPLRALGGGPMGEGFVHGSGCMSSQHPPTRYMFYSPLLARWFDKKENAYHVINWPQSPNAPVLFEHKLLYYARYKYLGDGVLEIAYTAFNFSEFTYGMSGKPWGGVRNSTFPYVFEAKPDKTLNYMDLLFGDKGCNKKVEDTCGWLAAAADKEDTESLTFGFVFGNRLDRVKGIKKPSRNVSWGRAGRDLEKVSTIAKRDYIVMASNVGGDSHHRPGTSYWLTYYLVVGKKQDVIKNMNKYADKPNFGIHDFNEKNTTLSPLYADTDKLLSRERKGNAKTVGYVYNQPVKNSQPLFRIEEVGTGKKIITVNPYDFSYKMDWENVLPEEHERYEDFNNRKLCLPHISHDAKPLNWTLLGFVIPEKNAELGKDKYVPLSSLVDVPESSKGMLVRNRPL